MSRPSVSAVIVTFNRSEVLRTTLGAVDEQRWTPETVYVIDNASKDDTQRVVERDFPSATYIRMPENLGFAAGLAEGMRRAVEAGSEYVWLLDDDSRPAPSALERCMAIAVRTPELGAVGLSGGMLPRGVPDRRRELRRPYVLEGEADLYLCDFVLLDGAVVSRDAIIEHGVPRADFFMMYEDVEYTGRLSRAGRAVVLLDQDLIDRGHLGSGGASPTEKAPPWRGYYQTRNHFLTARQTGRLADVVGWGLRQGKLALATLMYSDRKLTRLRLRGLGAWHGWRGVTGKTIDPMKDR